MTDWLMIMTRFFALALGVTLLLSGCGGGEMSLTEYVDRLNGIISEAGQKYEVLVAGPQGEVLVAEAAQLNDFSPQDLQAGLDGIGEIEVEVDQAVAAIEPPELVADLHHLLFDDRFTVARKALAARAGAAADWEELSATPEMAAYRAAVARDKEVCTEIQNELDATAQRGDFADTPWLPGELKEVVEAVLGCTSWPEHPEDLYRPPPSAAP